MDFLIDFLKWTKVDMVKPEPYGVFHLSFLFGGLLLIAGLLYLLRGASPRTQKIVLWTSAIILVVVELYKQLFFTFVLYEEYKWYSFPLQLCSSPMYLVPLFLLLKSGNLKTGLMGYVALFGTLGGLSVMVYPTTVFMSTVNISVQTMVWHLMLIFIGLFLLVTKQFGTKKGDYKKAVIAFASIVGIVIVFNVIMYHVLNPAGTTDITTFNMFFVSPYFITNFPLLNSIQEFSYVVFIVSYVVILSGLAGVIYGVYQLFAKRVTTKKPQPVKNN